MIINHINDVLPHVEGRKDFVVVQKDGYTVIDYVFAGADTFDHPARIECRGLKFGPDGKILARPFQKFFNIGERSETIQSALDFTQPHSIMEKLDGSMIHPAIVNGEVVFMTRMGRTDHARRCEERHLTPERALMLGVYLNDGWTPIFEWTAPENRIVVSYGESRLTLLALRRTVEGYYIPRPVLESVARDFDTPVVAEIAPTYTTAAEFVDFARAIRGAEGFVVRFANGLMVKAKGEEYVLQHRAKDDVTREHDLVTLIVNGGIDDVLPLLADEDRAPVEEFRVEALKGMLLAMYELLDISKAGAGLTDKEFALQNNSPLRPLAFQMRKGVEPLMAIKAAVLKGARSASTLESVRHLIGGARLAANDNFKLSEAA